MPRSTPPYGYAVVQLEDTQWYPLEVTRSYSGEHPDGYIHLSLLSVRTQEREFVEAHYTHREDALNHVRQYCDTEERWKREKWEHLTCESNVYPERCSHYRDLIQEIVGHAPTIVAYQWRGDVSVHVLPYQCPCGAFHSLYWTSDATVEDVLQRAADYVYEHRCSCTATTAREYEQLAVANS